MAIFLDELPEDVRERFAAMNPELQQALAERAQEPRRARRYAARVPVPSKAEWAAFEKAQARFLEAAQEVNEAYARRNAHLMVRSVETARIVVVLLALVILVILAIGVAGGSGK